MAHVLANGVRPSERDGIGTRLLDCQDLTRAAAEFGDVVVDLGSAIGRAAQRRQALRGHGDGSVRPFPVAAVIVADYRKYRDVGILREELLDRLCKHVVGRHGVLIEEHDVVDQNGRACADQLSEARCVLDEGSRSAE